MAQNPIDTLIELPEDTCLIITKPLSPFFQYQLKNSVVWQSSPFSKPDTCVYTIDSVWNPSGVEAIDNFAEHLAWAVENDEGLELI